MTKVDWDKIIEKFGWKFIPSQDIPTEHGVKAWPECWVNGDEILFSRTEVITFIMQHQC